MVSIRCYAGDPMEWPSERNVDTDLLAAADGTVGSGDYDSHAHPSTYCGLGATRTLRMLE